MKLTKSYLKKIIKEEISGGKSLASAMSSETEYIRNYPDGERPDNSAHPKQFMREPYETLGVQTHIEDGEILITIGKTKYKLIFENEDLTSGYVIPVDQYKFTIENNVEIKWFQNVPTHVRNDSQLNKQILDFSGREE